MVPNLRFGHAWLRRFKNEVHSQPRPAHHKLIQNHLNDVLQTVSKRSFTNFANWRRIRIAIPFITRSKVDCAAFVFKLLELFDGQNVQLPTGLDVVSTCELHHFPTTTFTTIISMLTPCVNSQVDGASARAEMLHYMLFHQLNLIAKLPREIESFREAGVQS
jgi:hypothetical protein